jgi:hypothetical protein
MPTSLGGSGTVRARWVFGRVDELPPGRISQHSTSHSYARAWHVDPIADLQPG